MSEARADNLTNDGKRGGAGRLCALLAEFPTPDALKAAAARVRDAGFTRWDAHSPFPVHGLDPQMGIRPTRLPWLVFVCGLLGCGVGLLLQWWTNATNADSFRFVPTFLQGYNFQISGKPDFSLPANIPVVFELTVLFAALGSGIGMLVFNNLPRFYNPIFANRRFQRATSDAFFIRIDREDPLFKEAETREFLEALDAKAVEPIIEQPGDARPPKILVRTAVIAACVALIPLAVIAVARSSRSPRPRIHIIQDMDNQVKYRVQQAGPFVDGRIMRPPVSGTIARGELRDDDHFFRGRVNGEFAATFPTHRGEVDLSEDFIRRGQRQFNIYCSACHGRDGHGQGMVNQRATELGPWVPASDLHDDTIRGRRVGDLFDTITNGNRNMPPYGAQLSVRDRWAVVAYIRALQRASRASLDDLSPEHRTELESR